ncbi:MAG: hypothetical protein ACK42Z_07860 [Candidatus Kapaibacteriota bacterium]
MTLCEALAKLDTFVRSALVQNFPYFSCFTYSYFRKFFLNRLKEENLKQIRISDEFKIKLWGIKFRTPLFNAAGMFKDGRGYQLAYSQYAGAFLAGTVTPKPRLGNFRKGILHPFVPYPFSGASSNWLGLPNPGYNKVISLLQQISKAEDFPIGLSIASDGNTFADLEVLCKVFKDAERYNIDFIELNESCPNVNHEKLQHTRLDEHFIGRLEYVSTNFLKKRRRNLPVILKLSNDLQEEFVPNLLDIVIDLGFDGINFGNTSTNYEYVKSYIAEAEQRTFDYFTTVFGGGVGGSPLKEKSHSLTKCATEYLRTKSIRQEFIVIRTGGIKEYRDLEESKKQSVALFQWYTGYFENFAKFGHSLYQNFFRF